MQGIPLVDMSLDDLMRAVDDGLRSNFITARAAARQMSSRALVWCCTSTAHREPVRMAGMGSTGPS